MDDIFDHLSLFTMKKLFFIFCLLIFLQSGVRAQTPLKLQTGPMKGAKIVIMPSLGNLLALLNADSVKFAATMKLYQYIENLKTPGAFYAKSTSDKYEYYIVRKKGDVAIMLSQFTSALVTLQKEVKKRFPHAYHDTGRSLEETYNVRMNIRGQMVECLLDFDTVDTDGPAGAQLKISDYRFN